MIDELERQLSRLVGRRVTSYDPVPYNTGIMFDGATLAVFNTHTLFGTDSDIVGAQVVSISLDDQFAELEFEGSRRLRITLQEDSLDIPEALWLRFPDGSGYFLMNEY